MRRTSPALSTAPRLELTLRGDRATSLRRRGAPVPSGASENGALAQLGERRNGIAEVAGSIPACSTNEFEPVSERVQAFLFPGSGCSAASSPSLCPSPVTEGARGTGCTAYTL